MDMIDQYLEAVAAQLPEAERDDIIAELRDLILSRFEARESQLGRALDDNQRLEILREIGHPLVVAGRYRKGPEALIGPALFPYWLFAVKAGLLIQAALFALSLLLGLLSDPQHFTRDVMQAIHNYIWSGLAIIGATTLVGAVLEHNRISPRWMKEWRIGDLKLFNLPANWIVPPGVWKPAGRAARVKRRRLPGIEHIFALVAASIFLVWWTGLVQFDALSRLRRHGEDVLVTAAPIWTALYAVILIFILANMAAHLFGLLRPQVIRLQAVLEIVLACAGLWILWTVHQAGHLATLSHDGRTAAVHVVPLSSNLDPLKDSGDWLARGAATLSITLSWVMLFIAIATLANIARGLWKLARSDA